MPGTWVSRDHSVGVGRQSESENRSVRKMMRVKIDGKRVDNAA